MMKKEKQILMDLVENNELTLRSAVEALEKKGLSPVEASETLCECIIDESLTMGESYSLSLNKQTNEIQQ